MKNFQNKVAVVTGGAGGIGKGLVKALLNEGCNVVIADVEQSAMEAAQNELGDIGPDLSTFKVDVRDPASVNSLADYVYDKHGVCHLLFNNAGVAAPNANVWETTPNDWDWVFGVNVRGVAHGLQAFVPRMIAGGEEGHIINTSSGDGGISSLPYQSVYASSKAAVSAMTDCLGAQLISEKTNLRASIFYPSGGMLVTGIWNPDRNRPEALKREKPGAPVPKFEDFMSAMEASGHEIPIQDLDELGQSVLEGVKNQEFIIMKGLDHAVTQLRDRADRYSRAELPINMEEVPQL